MLVRTGCNPTVLSDSSVDQTIGVFAPSAADGGKTLTSGDSNVRTYSQHGQRLIQMLVQMQLFSSDYVHMERRLSSTSIDSPMLVT
jgi:hypothetical protein